MRLSVLKKSAICCLVLLFAAFGVFGQQRFSLDDAPSAPYTGPLVPAPPNYYTAEDEFGLGLPPFWVGLIGPSPSLFWWGLIYYDSDILLPGPALFFRFPPPQQPFPAYMDAFSYNHWPNYGPDEFDELWLRFSIDRATGGIDQTSAGLTRNWGSRHIFFEKIAILMLTSG